RLSQGCALCTFGNRTCQKIGMGTPYGEHSCLRGRHPLVLSNSSFVNVPLLSRWLLPTMGIEFNFHANRHDEGLMHGATMRHLVKLFALSGRNAMRHVNRQCDPAHPMRLFRHEPFRFNTQPFGRNLMAVAVATHKITDTTGEGTDKEFDWTHAGILSPILD